MKVPATPANEDTRIYELRGLEILDTEPDPVLDTITALAADIMDVPIALVSLVDVDRQWFMSRVGLLAKETSRDISFCGHVVAQGTHLVVGDTLADDRFADNPMVTEDPHIRFYAGVPLRSTSGSDLGTLCAIDREPRQPSERQLRALSRLAHLVVERIESRRRHALARQVVDHVPGMLAYWDSHQRCRFANAAYKDWFGITPEALLGKTMKELLGPLYAANLPHIEAALRGEVQSFERTIPRRDGGAPRVGQAHYLPHAINGAVVGFVVMVTDVSKLKELESSLAATAREREILLQEIHHRVKNNLQVISSLINMQMRKLEPSPTRDALEECQTRVLAIALIHEKLYQSKDYSNVQFAEYARSLAANVFHATGMARVDVSLELAIADVKLGVDRAIPCGLVINELITNALKHGFAPGRGGRVRVELVKLEDGNLRLGVEDDGEGLPDGFDIQKSDSMGLQLVCTLAEQLAATLVVRGDSGASFYLTFKGDDA